MNERVSDKGRLCPGAEVLLTWKDGTGGRGLRCSGQELQRGDARADFGGERAATEAQGVSLGLVAAGAQEKQGFSSRLSSQKLQNKGKLCKTSCRRTLVPNRHVVFAAKAPAQGERDLISFPSFPLAARAAKARSACAAWVPVPPPQGHQRGQALPSLPTTSPAPR